MKKPFQLLLVGITATSLFACKKNNDQTSTVSTNDAATMQSLFKTLAVQPKTVTMDAGVDNTFYGNSGTRYVFYANSLMTASGALVTGNVQVTVAEYLSKGDMIFSKMLPISDGEPLLSGGEVNVVVTQNGQEVYLQPLTVFRALVPQNGTAPTGMKLFTGQAVTNAVDTAQRLVNWHPKDTVNHGTLGIWPSNDTLGIISDSLNLCNADQFMTSPNYQTFTVTVKGVTAPSSAGTIFGYALYDNYKGVWPLGVKGSYKNGVFTEEHVPNIPVHFAVFGYIDGKFYGGTAAATPATSSNYNVTLTVVDPAEFKAQLNAL